MAWAGKKNNYFKHTFPSFWSTFSYFQYIDITNKIASIFIISQSLGPDVFPPLVGAFIVGQPMFLMYMTFGCVVVCIVLYALANVFALKLQKAKKQDLEGKSNNVSMEDIPIQ